MGGFSTYTPSVLFTLWQEGNSMSSIVTTTGLDSTLIANVILAQALAGCFIPINVVTLMAYSSDPDSWPWNDNSV